MKLTLTLTRGDDPQGTPIDSRSFDDRGLTLGRGSENDWVLDDPNRHLSKSHCAIEFDGGEFLVTDTSTNGVFINLSPERLGRGNTIGLRDGDQIGLGEYLVQVQVDADGAEAGAIDDDFSDLGGGFDAPAESAGAGDAGDPFADNADLPGPRPGAGRRPIRRIRPGWSSRRRNRLPRGFRHARQQSPVPWIRSTSPPAARRLPPI